ncbi:MULTISPECIES: phosphocholine-specific phospholipase C [Lysobacter]|uniref:phosphocholine-specific phospholipase C n=1 Tax=Lysobacter TaxID=68 RepID=UPI001F2D9D3A|nr:MULTISPECIES: phospholipase C, phosphocholine-specific [Lysobacter]UJB17340.1 phospholipase C, phosphocholine-specific [Lysobacter capsici]UJQ28937.1 phospholipase C, phosphocholine-specific [Lysobacter gummosus]
MISSNRRDFLKLAGGAAALSLLPPSIRAALATPAARVTGTIQDVQHVVILMQENRSFDHYLGALRGVRGFDDPRPIPLPGGKTVFEQPKSATSPNNVVLPFHLDTASTAAHCLADIDHSWKGAYSRWKDYNAWISVKGPMCMGHFTRQDMPFYYALADAFTVCDAYYCSHHGPTNPNRMHLFAGTSGMTVGDLGPQAVNNADDGNWTADMARDNPNFAGHRWTTYAERLQNAGIAWRVYQEHDNYGDNSLAYFANFRKLDTNSELYKRGRAWAPGSTAENATKSRGEYLIADFAKDVRENKLPAVSWIVPSYIMSEHPAATPAYGESLTARLLEALVANPEVWSKTVFIINYDENGGFFDHVPAPLPAINSDLGKSTVDTATENYNGIPVGLGVRVPMFVISPWSKGGWVNSQVFDHTSVLRFLESRFGIAEPNISAWRRTVAGDLSTAFDFDTPNTSFPVLPSTNATMANADASCKLAKPTAPAQPSMPRQERGQRLARALPYELRVDGRIEASSGRYWLDFGNDGIAGACYNVYAGNRTDGPWYYTLDAGTQLSDYWSAKQYTKGIYDLSAYGPNGFLRVFRGDLNKALTATGANPEVSVRHDAAAEQLTLTLVNTGKAACRLTLKPNRYSSAAARTFDLAPGARTSATWPLATSRHWYDFSVTSNTDAGYLRRFAGHAENGSDSVSDPAIGA